MLADVLDKAGEELAQALMKKYSVKVFFQHCDMASPNDIAKLFSRIEKEFGRLDFAFNNAGTEGVPALTQDCTLENWDRVIDINLRGTWLCLKHEISLMLKNKKGSIVNCSSIAGLVGFAGTPAYVASKHGVVGLTKVAALENAQTGIRVNALCPGVIETPMIERFTGGSDDATKNLIKGQPMGRMGHPQEMADVVMWFFSDQSSFVTGQALAADGGWVAQ
jgi:NAD(P)-dependent dehydrogenase (short-subunit alcohol dehydrogenase family)